MSRALRQQMLDYCGLVYAKGWVANHDGNLSARQGAGRFLATPTAMSKRDIVDSDLIVVDDGGAKLSGKRRPFSEMALHLAVYKVRHDATAVIHAHPPYATAMSVAGIGIERPIIAEAVVSIGDHVPLVPFAPPKSAGWTAFVEDEIHEHDVVILQNHGVLACGDDLEQAFLRIELVEHLATILHHAAAFGGPRYIDPVHVGSLMEARAKAGLGPMARGVAPKKTHRPHVDAGPRPAPAPPSSQSGGSVRRDDLVRIITEEIAKLK